MTSLTTDSTSSTKAPGVNTASVDEQLRRLEPLLHTIPQADGRRKRTVAVMPAYNAEATIERTLNDIPAGHVDEVILVDDGSSDRTADVARSLGITVIEREQNGGYGANQKTCYQHALERDADFVVMLHPDFQYDSRVAGIAVDFLKLGICDVVLGSRIRTRREALDGGMPAWKYVANRILTTVENVALGQNLGDFHSGFRAYSREVLETIPFRENSNDFVFDSQFLAQAVHFGFRIGDVPVPVRYFEEASSIPFRRCVTYGCGTLGVLAEFYAHRLQLIDSPRFRKATDLSDTATSSPNTSSTSFPNSSLGTPLPETPFRVPGTTATGAGEDSRSRASRTCVPKPEFGNEETHEKAGDNDSTGTSGFRHGTAVDAALRWLQSEEAGLRPQ